ncbi:OTU domain-containing protein 3-like isoform X2 [Babylonia areolata]|uniref:OTU domain-containing protein 3-like isoform X2 n=1 Tax=Babylonia areolata TaxID=304850 RepID=UPI003FD2FF0E
MTRNQRYNPQTGQGHPPHPNSGKKQQERAVRDAHRKERKINSYLADDENFPSFAIQLKKLGLQLRDIPGDGNCLFRALGDQLEGHCQNHYQHRQDTVRYMLNHRTDFEPFVEDDVPFDEHINNLRKQGTHAGNDAIVAFAKLHNVNVMIHQLNGKPLMIQGPSQGLNIRQLHIAYHNGDHYSSIRRHGDNSQSPANICLQEDAKVAGPSHSYSDGLGSAVSHCGVDHLEVEVMKATGCQSVGQVREALADCDYQVDAAIATLMQTMELGDGLYEEDDTAPEEDSGLWGPEGTGSRIFGGGVSGHYCDDSSSSSGSFNNNRAGGARPKHSVSSGGGRKARETKKMEKKRRAEERHRQRVLGLDPQRQLRQEIEQEGTTVITHDVTRI